MVRDSRRRAFAALAIVGFLAFSTSCTPEKSAGPDDTSPGVVTSIEIVPSSMVLDAGGTGSFQVRAEGGTNTQVTLQASGGSGRISGVRYGAGDARGPQFHDLNGTRKDKIADFHRRGTRRY